MKKLNIWKDEGKISVLLIEKFAENLGITLPKSYIDLISGHDYLSPEEDSFFVEIPSVVYSISGEY